MNTTTTSNPDGKTSIELLVEFQTGIAALEKERIDEVKNKRASPRTIAERELSLNALYQAAYCVAFVDARNELGHAVPDHVQGTLTVDMIVTRARFLNQLYERRVPPMPTRPEQLRSAVEGMLSLKRVVEIAPPQPTQQRPQPEPPQPSRSPGMGR